MKKLLILSFCAVTAHAQTTSKLSLLFTGDIMQHQVQITTSWQPDRGRYDYLPCFRFIKPILSAPDVTIGNLELTLAGPPYTGYPNFSAPDELLPALKDAGFDVLVSANNHALDRGRKGLERTIDMLDSAGFQHTGTFKDTLDWLNNYPLLIQSKGFRISLLNYTYGLNGLKVRRPNKVNLIDTTQIRMDVAKAGKQNPDIVIAFMHWGNQYENLQNSEQKKQADYLFSQGVDVIIGSHPHVLQPMEWRKDKNQVVIWSLGNFLGNQPERYRGIGALLYLDLEKTTYPDRPSETKIIDVSYGLSWVYREGLEGNFVILPVEQFKDDTVLVTNKNSRDRLKLLRSDTEKLFGKENRNVNMRPPGK